MSDLHPYTACEVCGRRVERHFNRWMHAIPRPVGNDLADFGQVLGAFSLATTAHDAQPRAECGPSCLPDARHYDDSGNLAGIGMHTVDCDSANDRGHTLAERLTLTAEIWAGEFGSAYAARNQGRGFDRDVFWSDFRRRYPVGSALEVGCGTGANLRHLRAVTRLVGVDINALALEAARIACPSAALRIAPAERLPFADRSFGLVFTVGLLIHISPPDFANVVREIWRVASKYILTIEYESDVEEERDYRGRPGLLWRRPFRHLFDGRAEYIETGFLSRPAFHDCTYHLWQKPE